MEPGGDTRSETPDRQLVRAVESGDSSALGQLFDRYSPVVLALCVRMLRDRSDAEEVLGDVFWELWSRPGRYDATRGNMVTYLVTLARSRCLDRLRSRKRSPVYLLSEESESLQQAAATQDDAEPLQNAIVGQRRDRIRQALEALKPDQRQAIELSFFSGLSHSEISQELAQPLGTVKSRIRNGLILLKDSLRVIYGGGETA